MNTDIRMSLLEELNGLDANTEHAPMNEENVAKQTRVFIYFPRMNHQKIEKAHPTIFFMVVPLFPPSRPL